MDMTFEQLQQAVFKAQHDAEQADRLWQAALDKAKIDRYSRQAKYDERVKDFYLARLRAVVTMHEAQDSFRHFANTRDNHKVRETNDETNNRLPRD